ncbi:MAG TPA: cyclic pyranopterin monophosphate synthase MoaC [Candidatus Thalassarchaeaceae archaeon]|nr:cyclic pyranopterin monophosphate synthase MoaC [Candidatus Thalassarchaeaceae archaeon]
MAYWELGGDAMTFSRAGIIDVGSKPAVFREATATGRLVLSDESLTIALKGQSLKGDVREASSIAAIQAVKDTSRTLPHCHPIPIEACTVDWENDDNSLRCVVSVRTHWSTGVEMEALCGVSAALLCAWDMLKSSEKDQFGQYPEAKIEDLRVLKKIKGNP